MNEGLPDEDSIWSLEGTFLHDISALCLQFGFDAYDLVGAKRELKDVEFEMTEEFADLMQPGLDRFREFGGEMFVEKRVPMDKWSNGDFGTLDVGIITKKYIVVGDWKWGEGEPVEVVRNKQLLTYGLCFWYYIARHKTKAKRFIFIIEQPRVAGGGGTWECDLDELLEFAEELEAAAAATRKKNAPRIPSAKACRWCKAVSICKEYAEFMHELMGRKFEDLDKAEKFGLPLDPRKPTWFTPERRATILMSAPMIRRWLDALHADALADAEAGRPLGHMKAVDGRNGPRHWKDKEAAEKRLTKFLREQAYDKKLKSPTQVEKDLAPDQWSQMQKFIGQNKGKPVLVPLDDPRPAITPVKDKFENLDEV